MALKVEARNGVVFSWTRINLGKIHCVSDIEQQVDSSFIGLTAMRYMCSSPVIGVWKSSECLAYLSHQELYRK